MDGQPFNRFLGRIGLGHHGDGKAQLGGFLEPLLSARCRVHLAEGDEVMASITAKADPGLAVRLPPSVFLIGRNTGKLWT